MVFFVNRHERRAANAQQKKQKRAFQVPLDAIARRIEEKLSLTRGRLRLTLKPMSATESQYQLFAEPRLDDEMIARVQKLLAAELGKFSKARGGTVDEGAAVPEDVIR
jgi:hypothetical protein